ncbi:MAG: c-type cytochrome, partial [Chitinophagaceae bacterium]|nr:c-type cytochrome [Chitinophagaceae bacterium]
PFSIDQSHQLRRNTPTVINAGFQTKQFFDSRADILENQLSEVVHNVEEMEGSMLETAKRINQLPFYDSLFKKAYPTERTISPFTIANSISCYIRSLVSLNAPFDQFMRGNKNSLSPSQQRGFNLFAGKAKCATCHFIPLFNGVVPPAWAETESEVLGVPATRDRKNPKLDDDPGKYLFTRSEAHRYAFKTPTLRNVALTAPYMHNGVYQTLEEVMEFYNKGGGKGLHIAPEYQTLPFDNLRLNRKEIKDIIAFMRALTDTSFAK